MMNFIVDLWHPDLVTIAASALAGVVALVGVLMSMNVFRHEGNAGTISPKKRTHAFVLVGLAVVFGAMGLLLAHVGAVWFSIHALGLIAVASLSLYERNNAKELMHRFGIRVAFGAFLVALGLVIMKFNPFQFAPSTVAAQVAFIFVFLGYGVSLGIAPMHTGLSELYSKIPSPIAALVAPLSLLVGTLGIFRMRAVIDALLADAGVWTGNILVVFGLITAAVLAGTLLRQNNYKKFFAELTIFHTGILFAFAGFGVAGTIPALMHLGVTVVAASALFCIAGILHATYKTTKFSGVRKMFTLLPVPSVLFVIVLIGALGVPVSGMFVSLMIGIGYGLQFHLVLAVVLALTWLIAIAAVSARLLELSHAFNDDAIALLPVRWRTSLAVLAGECIVLFAATWWIGTQQGITFFVDAAQIVSTF
jgi:hydrogenase-4 component F